MSSPTTQIVAHHILCVFRVCRLPHPSGILSSTMQTEWALFSINTTHTAIHMHLISQFTCKQSTFQSVRGHNLRIKSRSGDGSRHLGMWWTIVLHISWSTVPLPGGLWVKRLITHALCSLAYFDIACCKPFLILTMKGLYLVFFSYETPYSVLID